MPTTSSPHRATRTGDQRGQGTLEYVGIVVVSAILVAAVVLTDSGAQVRTAIGCQIRSIVTQSGSCEAGTPPGTVDPGEEGGDGGGTGTPTGWFNADPAATDPVDADVVDAAQSTATRSCCSAAGTRIPTRTTGSASTTWTRRR